MIVKNVLVITEIIKYFVIYFYSDSFNTNLIIQDWTGIIWHGRHNFNLAP